MKLHVLSDLHIEFSNYDIPIQNADVLVLAGDIGNGLSGIAFAKKYTKYYKHVVYVAGNHEYYGHNMATLRPELAKVAKESGVLLLDNNHVVIDDICIVGSTLWTDFKLYGDTLEQVGYAMNKGAAMLNDFVHIRYGVNRFMPKNSVDLSVEAQKYIEDTLLAHQDKKRVVITHHCPSMKSVSSKYAGSPINPCFASNFDKLVAKANLWIHGHTHDFFDYMIDKSRVICNPRGYSRYQEKQENIAFKPALVVEV